MPNLNGQGTVNKKQVQVKVGVQPKILVFITTVASTVVIASFMVAIAVGISTFFFGTSLAAFVPFNYPQEIQNNNWNNNVCNYWFSAKGWTENDGNLDGKYNHGEVVECLENLIEVGKDNAQACNEFWGTICFLQADCYSDEVVDDSITYQPDPNQVFLNYDGIDHKAGPGCALQGVMNGVYLNSGYEKYLSGFLKAGNCANPFYAKLFSVILADCYSAREPALPLKSPWNIRGNPPYQAYDEDYYFPCFFSNENPFDAVACTEAIELEVNMFINAGTITNIHDDIEEIGEIELIGIEGEEIGTFTEVEELIELGNIECDSITYESVQIDQRPAGLSNIVIPPELNEQEDMIYYAKVGNCKGQRICFSLSTLDTDCITY